MKVPTPVTWTAAQQTSKKAKNNNLLIGILALQGDFLEHIQALDRLGIASKEVKLPEDMEQIDGIILPGGESTTIARLLDVFQLREPLKKKIGQGMPVWGTCAGMILLAKKLVQVKPVPLGVMDIVVSRNAYGRQIDSFEADIAMKYVGEGTLHAAFIRAPKIEKTGPAVEVLAKLDDGEIIAVKQGNMIATSFHPELDLDTRVHEYFVTLVEHNILNPKSKITNPK